MEKEYGDKYWKEFKNNSRNTVKKKKKSNICLNEVPEIGQKQMKPHINKKYENDCKLKTR